MQCMTRQVSPARGVQALGWLITHRYGKIASARYNSQFPGLAMIAEAYELISMARKVYLDATSRMAKCICAGLRMCSKSKHDYVKLRRGPPLSSPHVELKWDTRPGQAFKLAQANDGVWPKLRISMPDQTLTAFGFYPDAPRCAKSSRIATPAHPGGGGGGGGGQSHILDRCNGTCICKYLRGLFERGSIQ